MFGLQVMDINAVCSSFYSYHFPVISVLSNIKIVTTDVQNCALLAKYCWGYTPFSIRMFKCALVKYQLSNYKCILHVKIQKNAFSAVVLFLTSFFFFSSKPITPLSLQRGGYNSSDCHGHVTDAFLKSADHEWNSLIPMFLCFALVLVIGASMLVPNIKEYWVWVTWNDIIVH